MMNGISTITPMIYLWTIRVKTIEDEYRLLSKRMFINMKKYRLISLFMALILMFGVSGCKKDVAEEKTNNIPAEDKVIEKDISVDEIIAEMSLEEKVYQMMFVTPEDITGVGTVISAGETTKNALKEYPVGGIIYFAQNLKDRQQTIDMLTNTQSYSEIPLFISVDEEGGRVSRLGSNPQMGTTKQPAMLEVGKTGDPREAYETGVALAKDLKSLGFNVDFAPVADVLISDKNVDINDRSFGTDPQLVASMVENAVKGLEENGVSATLKHFPGSGATTKDPHFGTAENPRTYDQLTQTELVPFKAGIEAGADFIMVSHNTLPNVTKEKLPSSLSNEVITGILIGELGYDGIIITDSFRMGAVTEHFTPAQIGVMAVKAGNDMILMPQDMKATHKGIVDAVNNGEITVERIDASVRKILEKKIEKGLLK